MTAFEEDFQRLRKLYAALGVARGKTVFLLAMRGGFFGIIAAHAGMYCEHIFRLFKTSLGPRAQSSPPPRQ